MCERLGCWEEVKAIFMKDYMNAVKVVVIEDCIKMVAFVVSDVELLH